MVGPRSTRSCEFSHPINRLCRSTLPGDINNDTMRLGFKATKQAKIAAANIKADILGRGERKTYDQGDSIMMVVLPVGASCGTGQLFGMTPFSFIVKMAQGKDYLVSKAPQYLAGKA